MQLRLGLLGHKISYSLSPRIFAWLFAESGLRGSYEIVELNPDDLHAAGRSVLRDFQGLNVTIPYKQTVYTWCDHVSRAAQQCRAVNALKIAANDSLAGHNTDIAGLACVLQEMVDPASCKAALLLGGGGAARAAIVSIREQYPAASTTVLLRSNGTTLKHDFPTIEVLNPPQLPSDLSEYDLVIQCTPVGSATSPGLPFDAPFRFRPQSVVIDLIYAPLETEFLKLAKAQAARTQNGMKMLIGQALTAFEWWTGIHLPYAHACRQLLPRLVEP